MKLSVVFWCLAAAVVACGAAASSLPTVEVNVDGDAAAAGNKVTGAGSFRAGSKTTLKATAAKGWVFAGWGEGSGVEGLAALNPSLKYVLTDADLTKIAATFVELRDDLLYVDDPGVVPVVRGATFSTNLVETIIETRSLPTVSISGLPSGIKYDAKTFTMSGTVGKTAKTGYCYATLKAKNAGGYTFTRILRFVILNSSDDDIPDEPELPNAAEIDFSALDGLATGDFLPASGLEAVGFYVDPSGVTGSGVASVTVSGLPAGLKYSAVIEDGVADVVVYGTPAKPGRYTLKVAVSYADKKRATSEYALVIEDGGSAWLDVASFDDGLGTVSGAGVYASGATVRLSAKPGSGNVFAGWHEDDGMPFAALSEMDKIDYRAASASFVFRRGMFAFDAPALFGGFVAKADDAISVGGFDDVWEIVPSEDGERTFEVISASLPKLTASGLPKGVTLDAAGGRLVYTSASADKVVPGWYTVTLKATNQSRASATGVLSVFVANKTADAIYGLDPSPDAYPIHAGVALDPELIMPEVDAADGWKLAASGLPAGLKFAQDKATGAYSVMGVPTKAGTFTVTFTATRGREKEVATITVCVAAMPEWAVGTFDGALFDVVDGETNAVGQVTATVSAVGKVSGKLLRGGKSYSFSAAAFGDYDAASSNFTALVKVPWSKTESEEFLLSVGAGENGVGAASMEPVGDGAAFAEAGQNVWLRKDLAAPAFATGAKQPTLTLSRAECCGLGASYDLTFKFGAKGVATIAGKIGGVAANGKSQTLLLGAREDGGYDARVVIYIANAKLAGGAFCDVAEVVLSDADGDGKLDTAAEAPAHADP